MNRILEIFVSSPGDLAEERRAVAEIIGRLARAPHISQRGYSLRAHLYEDVVPPVLANGPQDAINAFMMDPSRCDVLVCLLGDRLGTQMKDPRHSTETYVSGTVYEATTASESRKRPKPQVLIYYRRTPRDGCVAADRRDVDNFVAGIRGGVGPLRGIAPLPFDDSRDLAVKIAEHLDATVTHVTRLYETRRRQFGLLGLLAAVALGAGGYETATRVVDAAHDRGLAEAAKQTEPLQQKIDRLNNDEPGRRTQFLMDAIVAGPAIAIGNLDQQGCGAAAPLIDAVARLQSGGDLTIIGPAIAALGKLAAGKDKRCGCPELLSVLTTDDVQIRYCKSTHLLALEALPNLLCQQKSKVIAAYLGKIHIPHSLDNVFCKGEVPGALDDLEAAARKALPGPASSGTGLPP